MATNNLLTPSQCENTRRESLWKRASDILRSENPELFHTFEECVNRDLRCKNGHTGTLAQPDGLVSGRPLFERAENAIREKYRRNRDTSSNKKSQAFKRYFEQTLKAIGAFKSTIATAVSSDVHVSLAWAAVCLVLPLLLNPMEQSERAVQGLNYITGLLMQYRWKERIYTSAEGADDFDAAVVPLYTAVLSYLAQLTRHLSRDAPSKYARAVFKVDDWESGLEKIKTLQRTCDDLVHSMRMTFQDDAQRESLLLQRALLKSQQRERDIRITEMQERNIRSLYSSYKADKDRVSKRAEGTCEWFLTHFNFLTWREKRMSALLWLSGDPGCGKSVLSRHVVDNGAQVLRSSSEPATICYFFFKDGDSIRRSAASALRAVLHQLFEQNPKLCNYADHDFRKKEESLLLDFDTLWDILIAAAGDAEAGEIICVLDALDECEASERAKLISKLVFYYSDDQVGKNRNSQLKIITTSRPYPDIEDKFHRLTEASSTIRLLGEDESDKISAEIDIVIEARVPKVAYKLNSEAQRFLINHLQSTDHRTYLWAHLVFELIEERYEDVIKKDTQTTIRNLESLVRHLPRSVEAVYEAMLNRSNNPALARKLLRLILGALRPLTLREVNVLLALDDSLDSSPTSLVDDSLDTNKTCTSRAALELRLDDESLLKGKTKRLRGLLVNISSDSKLYLVHQTVREFLIRQDEKSDPAGQWQNSFGVIVSHKLLAEACITYLMFSDFENTWFNSATESDPQRDGDLKRKEWAKFLEEHHLLDYAANNWSQHIQDAERGQYDLQSFFCSSLMQICDINSGRFEILYQASRGTFWSWCRPSSSLYVAAQMGLGLVVDMLLTHAESHGEHQRMYDYGAALFKASEGGYTAIVKALLQHDAVLKGEEGHALIAACTNGHAEVVELLLDQNPSDANMCQTRLGKRSNVGFHKANYPTPLMAAAFNGHDTVVRLLLRKGAVVNVVHEYLTALSLASYQGQKQVVQTLLEHNAEPNLSPLLGSPINCAAEQGFVDVVELLLQFNASPNADPGRNPLVAAVKDRNLSLIHSLLRKGAQVNCDFRGAVNCEFLGENALTIAAQAQDMKIMQILLDNGAQPDLVRESTDDRKLIISPLESAAFNGDGEMIRLLLAHGAQIDKDDSNSLSALQWAIIGRHFDTAQFLVNIGANPRVVGRLGSAIQVAVEIGRLDFLKLLLDAGADVNAVALRRSFWSDHPYVPEHICDQHIQGTALQRAVALDLLEVVRFLCETGANVNLVGSGMHSASKPLHVALKHSFRGTIALLLEREVDIDAECLELACAQGLFGVLKQLQEGAPCFSRSYSTSTEAFSRLRPHRAFSVDNRSPLL